MRVLVGASCGRLLERQLDCQKGKSVWGWRGRGGRGAADRSVNSVSAKHPLGMKPHWTRPASTNDLCQQPPYLLATLLSRSLQNCPNRPAPVYFSPSQTRPNGAVQAPSRPAGREGGGRVGELRKPPARQTHQNPPLPDPSPKKTMHQNAAIPVCARPKINA